MQPVCECVVVVVAKINIGRYELTGVGMNEWILPNKHCFKKQWF